MKCRRRTVQSSVPRYSQSASRMVNLSSMDSDNSEKDLRGDETCAQIVGRALVV